MGAPDGISVGQTLAFFKVSLRPGNVTMLNKIPEELQFVMSKHAQVTAGSSPDGRNSAFVDTRMGDKVRVRLPSGRLKDLPSSCRVQLEFCGPR